MAADLPELTDFPSHYREGIRYCDTDRQGHVNNAVFVVLFESGRVNILLNPDAPVLPDGCSFMLARMAIDFRREISWPGEVTIGTRIAALGNSSIRLEQALFQHGLCVASAESVAVMADNATRRSTPLPEQARGVLSRYLKA